jgi:HEAT repeat protein
MEIMHEPETNAETEPSWRRRQAADAIALFGAEARWTIPELIELMKRGTNDHWSEAQALTGIGADALMPLALALTNSDARLHRGAALALNGVCHKYYGERLLTNALPALTNALLKDPDVEVRQSVAQTMWSVRLPEGMPALLASLSDPDRSVRGAALGALDYTYDRESPKAMLAVLKKVREDDPDESIRLMAGRLFDQASKWPPQKATKP